MDYIKVSECAKRIGVTRPTIYRYCETGVIPSVKINVGIKNKLLIKRDDFERVLLDGKL